MRKPRLNTRRASLSLPELAEQTKISRSTLSRMSDEELQMLSTAVDEGKSSKEWRPTPNKQQKAAPEPNPLLDALNAAEAACIRTHFAIVALRMDCKDSTQNSSRNWVRFLSTLGRSSKKTEPR